MALALLGAGVGGFAALNLHLVRGDLLPGGRGPFVAQIVLGVAGLALFQSLSLERVSGRRRPTPGLPARLVPATAVTVFGAAAVVLGIVAVEVVTDDGPHWPRLVLTAVALATIAAFYAAQLRRPSAVRSEPGSGSGSGARQGDHVDLEADAHRRPGCGRRSR